MLASKTLFETGKVSKNLTHKLPPHPTGRILPPTPASLPLVRIWYSSRCSWPAREPQNVCASVKSGSVKNTNIHKTTITRPSFALTGKELLEDLADAGGVASLSAERGARGVRRHRRPLERPPRVVRLRRLREAHVTRVAGQLTVLHRRRNRVTVADLIPRARVHVDTC